MANAQRSQESRWVGRVLRDKWRIDGRIARGGMGTVFAATHKNNGSTAAIKILHAAFSRDDDTRSRFLQEGYAANKVNHPGVVRILDDDVTEEGLAYLVMELLEGELLEQRRIRKGGRLPLPEVYELADQLLDVLAAAHTNGIVHRDIKPDNIFLTREGRLKVLDFGFAQMKTGFRKEQTATGFLLGTPGFMAPEQASGNRPLIDAQTDIWAVGATLFVLLTGQPVHEGESAAEMLVAAANFPVRSISTLEPGLPTKLSAAIDRALAFSKAERWPDARSMQLALRNALAAGADPNSGRARWGQSIPDGIRRPLPRLGGSEADVEDTTLADSVEELDEDELYNASETAIAVPRAHSSAETDIDGEAPTVTAMFPLSTPDRAFALPQLGTLDETESTDATAVMDPRLPANASAPSRPSRPDGFAPLSKGLVSPYDGAPMGSDPRSGGASAPMRPSRPEGFLVGPYDGAPMGSDPRSNPAQAGEGLFSASPVRPPMSSHPAMSTQPASHPVMPTQPAAFRVAKVERGGARVLFHVLVAVIAMVVVILGGLLILVGLD